MDFAALGIKIDSSQAKQAFADLEKLADAGTAADKAVTGIGGAGKKAALGLAEASKAATAASKSIDDYVQKLQFTAKTNGMSAREAKLYDLALQGASAAQLKAADSAIRMNDAYQRGVEIGKQIKVGLIAIAAAAGAAATGAYVAANRIAESIAKYQDLADKTGETAQNIASLQTASDLSGVSLDTVASASVRLTAALSKTDDESKLVAKGIKALGLSFDDFKKLSPAQQMDTLAKAFSGFADGPEKAAAAVAILGKAGADLLPFFNDLAEQGERQIRLTDEQIKRADDYTKAQARLKSEITAMAQVIVAESLPALTDLTGAFKDVIQEIAGTGKAATDLGSNNSIATFAEDGARFLARLADMAVTVGEAFVALGKTIGAVGAIQMAVVKGELGEAVNIGKAYLSDAKQFFGTPSLADALDKRISARKQLEAQRRQEDRGYTPNQPRINAAGLNTDRTKKGRDTSAQEAKAQLAYDLEDIRNAQEKLANTIANGEKLLEAKRQANLITEKDYWEQKRQFLIDNQKAEEDGLQKQIARLEQEKLTGKAKIDNDRKIMDLEAKLAKVRENGAASLEVLSIKQTDALDKIRIKFEEAQKAAQNYVDTISRQNQRDLAGMGRGSLQRDIDSRRSQREDQYLNRTDQIASQFRAGQITKEEYDKYLAVEKDAYDKALKLDADYWDARRKNLKDGLLGVQEALQNYIDEIENAYERANRLVTDGLGGLTDSITDAIMGDGKASFEDLGKNIAKSLLKGIVEQQITKPIAQWLQGSLNDPDSFVGSFLGGLTSNRPTGENWLGFLGLGGSSGYSQRDQSQLDQLVNSLTGSGSAAADSASATATAAMATSAAGATAALGALAAAASAAAASMGGSSFSGLIGGGGFGTGADFGNLDFGQFFADGGYTGAGARLQPAGVVHAGEYVINAENTRRLGLSFLDRLNRRGYADGGYVSSIMGGDLRASAAAASAPIGGNVYITVPVNGQVDRRTREQIAGDISIQQRNARRFA